MNNRDFVEVKNQASACLFVIIENAKLLKKYNNLFLFHLGIDDLRHMHKACNDLVGLFEKEIKPFIPKTEESELTKDK